MSLPTPNLDDLQFQRDLVDEARRRIIRYCPEWTDYSLSDPGITLIELFAWMAEKLAYRLNRVPDKNYIKFMELLGIQLQPASSARVELTFWLATPFPVTPQDDTVAIVPQGIEVATHAAPEDVEVTFTTDERVVIYPPQLTHLRREQDFVKNYMPRLGVELFYIFTHPQPQLGDTFYLGFDETKNISGHILKLDFTCEETQASGVRRSDPPWVWECSVGNGLWQEIAPSAAPGERDTTGGLNSPSGQLVFHLPFTFQADQVHGRNGYWLRCRLEPRGPEQGMYMQSPRVLSVSAYSLGATTYATHAVVVREERLGRSNGEPGQVMRTQHAPILELRPDETVEVEELHVGELVFVPWAPVADFSHSDRFDRHFVLDASTGEVSFGPCIRQADGTMRQYGRVPEAGRAIRFNQYRWGGGIAGNVPAGRITILKSTVPYIDRVINLRRAAGGRDPETLEEVQMRARREIHAQQRAVTVEDYEGLSKYASRSVARVKCRPPSKEATLPPGTLELLIVPAVFDALRAGDLSKLYLDPELIKVIGEYLDRYRLLTTNLRIREPRYVGVKVEAEIVVSEYNRPDVVSARVIQGLRALISPLAWSDAGEVYSDIMEPDWEGWPFGRSLFISEIYVLIQKTRGVKHVLDVKLSCRPVVPAHEPASAFALSAEEVLTPVDRKILDIPADTLLCSLDHEIKIVEL